MNHSVGWPAFYLLASNMPQIENYDKYLKIFNRSHAHAS
jgi:hypothetical protein